MNLNDVKNAIQKKVGHEHIVFSRTVPEGIEVGINKPDGSGPLCSLLPIDDERYPAFVDFMARQFLKLYPK